MTHPGGQLAVQVAAHGAGHASRGVPQTLRIVMLQLIQQAVTGQSIVPRSKRVPTLVAALLVVLAGIRCRAWLLASHATRSALIGSWMKLSSPLYGSMVRHQQPCTPRRAWSTAASQAAQKCWSSFCPCCRRPVDIEISDEPPRQAPVAEDARGKYAYVITLWGKSHSYVIGALVLGHSIRATGTPHSLVCLHTDDVPENSLALLRRIWDCRLIEHVEATKSLTWAEQADRFEKVFTKLQAMRLVEFEKVLMMDIDLLVTTNIDNLFQLPAPAAMARGMNNWWRGYKHGCPIDGRSFFGGGGKGKYNSWCQGTGINAGVMLWQPNEAVFNHMLEELKEEYHPAHIRGNGPEQDYLSRYWAGAPWTNMAVEYNYQLHQMFFVLHPDYLQQSERAKSLEDPRRIKVVHFSGEPTAKPWRRVLDKKKFSREDDAEYLQEFAEEYRGYFLWVKRDPSAWAAVNKRDRQYGSLSLGEDGKIYRECSGSTSPEDRERQSGSDEVCQSIDNIPVDADGNGEEEIRLVPADPPEAATKAAMRVLEHCLSGWFDAFQALEKSLELDIVASLRGKGENAEGNGSTGDDEEAPQFTWKSTWFAEVPTPARAPARTVPQGHGKIRFKYQHENGWMLERPIGDVPDDASQVGKASVICSARAGASFAAFSEAGGTGDEPYLPEPGADALSGVFVKAAGTTVRPFLEGGDRDTSFLHFWVDGVTAGTIVLVAIIGLDSELVHEVLAALEPLGIPQGPVRSEYRALAAAGIACAPVPWVSTHASKDMAYASVPMLVRE